MFKMIGVAEKAGSGIDKIRAGWNSQHWRWPVVRERMHPDRVMWILPMISLIPEESLHKLESMFGTRFSKFREAEIQALVTADIEKYVDNARMRQFTGLHAADVTKLLQGLVARGALCQEGQGRWTQYSLPQDLLYLTSEIVGKSDHSPHLKPNAPHLSLDSPHSGSNSPHLEKDLANVGSPEDNFKKKLEEIAASASQSGALPGSQMREIILKLCKEGWLTRLEISELVNRHPDGMRDRFLTPLVNNGKLKLRYPDKPNRVDQAYRTVEPIE
jgi:ATP-dependent DNA helicase RecG